MKTKTYIASAALLALSAVVPTSAFAVDIVATVSSYTGNNTEITPPGGTTSGSGALFTLVLDEVVPSGTGIPGIDVDQEFLAMCLEPTQTVGTATYNWNVVALEDAPTTATTPGGVAPMTNTGAQALMRALVALNAPNLAGIQSDMDSRNALQAAAWQASNPDATMTVPASALGLWNTLLNAMTNGTATNFPGLTVYALENLGKSDGSGPESGQDLFLFTYDPGTPPGGNAPEPTTVALFGLGLAGMGLYRRRRMTS